MKTNINRARNSRLIGTTRFASINDHLGVDKCDIFDSCCAKSNAYSSATSLRWFEIPRVHASLLSSKFSFMTRSHDHRLDAKERTYFAEEEKNQYKGFVRGSLFAICRLFRLYSFSWFWREIEIFLSTQNLSWSLRARELQLWSCI